VPDTVHWTSLNAAKPQFENELGSVQLVDDDHLPVLSRLSVKRLTLAPRALREPQWNVSCNQAYVTTGTSV
jgi:oxalate decarboxylase